MNLAVFLSHLERHGAATGLVQLACLLALYQAGGKALTSLEIAEICGVQRQTVTNIMVTHRKSGLVSASEIEGHRYGDGPRLAFALTADARTLLQAARRAARKAAAGNPEPSPAP